MLKEKTFNQKAFVTICISAETKARLYLYKEKGETWEDIIRELVDFVDKENNRDTKMELDKLSYNRE